MLLNELIEPLISFKKTSAQNPNITDVCMDSREVKDGTIFICIEGDNFDGHRFAEDVVQQGAVAIVAHKPVSVPESVPVVYVSDTRRALPIIADRFNNHPTHKLHLVGVTGTNGKTSVTHFIKNLMDKTGINTGLIGTVGIKYGSLTHKATHTTPEAPILQRHFKNMLDNGVEAAVMEVSSHALVKGRVRGCDYDIAVFTNLSQDHLDYHETMEAYLQAKGLLFSQLGNTYNNKQPKAAVINADDQAADKLMEMTAVPVVTFGIEQNADFKAENIKITSGGTHFDLVTNEGTYSLSMPLTGRFSVYNILAAMAVCRLMGGSLHELVSHVEDIEGVPGRFETVDAGQDFAVVVDYSHTPDSLENILKTIREFANRRVITVVGCGGDRDKTKRPLMAHTAVAYSDVSIFTSDNPRSEDPDAIIKDMEAGVSANTYRKIVNRKEAINAAVWEAEPGDVILIAGKGHETYQIIGDRTIDFDDRQVAKSAIKERLEDDDSLLARS